jgi:hypothetical protein
MARFRAGSSHWQALTCFIFTLITQITSGGITSLTPPYAADRFDEN